MGWATILTVTLAVISTIVFIVFLILYLDQLSLPECVTSTDNSGANSSEPATKTEPGNTCSCSDLSVCQSNLLAAQNSLQQCQVKLNDCIPITSLQIPPEDPNNQTGLPEVVDPNTGEYDGGLYSTGIEWASFQRQYGFNQLLPDYQASVTDLSTPYQGWIVYNQLGDNYQVEMSYLWNNFTPRQQFSTSRPISDKTSWLDYIPGINTASFPLLQFLITLTNKTTSQKYQLQFSAPSQNWAALLFLDPSSGPSLRIASELVVES